MPHSLWLALSLGSSLLQTAAQPARDTTVRDSAARIRVGPDMLVSRDGEAAHTEVMVAVNPKNWRNVVGVSYYGMTGMPITTRAYASRDGGATWTPSTFREIDATGGGDPQIAFGLNGTALFASLLFVPDETGRTRAALYVYRSEDGGFTWSKPVDLGYSYDHEQIVIDTTKGRFAGRAYIGVLYGAYPEYTVGVFRSSDDGKSWVGPVQAASGQGKIGINDVTPLVMSDGTLVMPYGDFPHTAEGQKQSKTSTYWLAMSSDGGVSFAPPKKVVTQHYPKTNEIGRFGTFAQFAVDATSGPYRDRLYVVWADAADGTWRLFSSYSKDRGATWSTARRVDTTVPAGAHQFQPMTVVNTSGVLGVVWFDSRAGAALYDQYFTASVDGGETFLPAQRVSSASSMPLGAGNLAILPSTARYGGDTVLVSMLTAASRWGNGGDYMGLAADSRGVFRPMWADARSGAFQVFTAEVAVERGAPTAVASSATRTVADLRGKVELLFDPVRYDSATRVAELPVRLRNVSDTPIYGPVTVELVGFPTWGFEMTPPRVLNAANGQAGAGATFDYTAALGSAKTLAPHGFSSAVVWRLELVDPMASPSIQVVVKGGVDEKR